MLTQGTVIHAAYRVLERIGQGEIGEVYRAEQVATRQSCALKVLNAGLMSDSLLVERFKEEAKKASMLQHPNAVRIDGLEEAEDGRPFVVMEYLQGENLRELMAREGRLQPARACFVARQVAAVLQAAHAFDIVHQDVTPGNIMLVETPSGTRVKLLDCCIARIKEERRRDIGRITLGDRDVLMGRPEYFSPEMAVGKRGSELGAQSDLYSLGVVLYQMVCGKLPFETKFGAMDALLAHLLVSPQSIGGLGPDVPEELGRLVATMLEKKPESRPASCQIVVEELEKLEWVLEQPSRLASVGAPAEEAGETALPFGASTPISPLDSAYPSAGATPAIRYDTGKPETPVPSPPLSVVRPWPEAIPKVPRWRHQWAAISAIITLSFGLLVWFLAPLRSKLTRYFEPGASANSPSPGRSSDEATGPPGQAGQPVTLPPPQANAPPPASSPGPTPAISEVSPRSTSTKAGAGVSQDQGMVGEQTTPPGERASKPNRTARQPQPDPAAVRALTAEGDEFFRQGDYDRAIQSYERALRLDPSAEALRTKILRARTAEAAEQKYLNE
jgi:eukaryotic-like serine/threonine-protein kinase